MILFVVVKSYGSNVDVNSSASERTVVNESEQERSDRQHRDVWEKLRKIGKTPMNTTTQELSRELQLWQINERQKLKREKMSTEEQLIDLFFNL